MNKKLYTEADLRKAFNQGAITHKEGLNATEEGNKFIQSINQEYIELETEEMFTGIISGGLIPDGEIGGKGLTHHTNIIIKTNRVNGQLMAYILSKKL